MDVQFHENGRVTVDFSDVLEQRIAALKGQIDADSEKAFESELLKRGWATPQMHDELRARAASAKARHMELATSVMEAASNSASASVPTVAYRLLEQQLQDERTRRLEQQAMGSMYARELAKSSKAHSRKTRTIKTLRKRLEDLLHAKRIDDQMELASLQPLIDSPAQAPQADTSTRARLPAGYEIVVQGVNVLFHTPKQTLEFSSVTEPDPNRTERAVLRDLIFDLLKEAQQ